MPAVGASSCGFGKAVCWAGHSYSHQLKQCGLRYLQCVPSAPWEHSHLVLQDETGESLEVIMEPISYHRHILIIWGFGTLTPSCFSTLHLLLLVVGVLSAPKGQSDMEMYSVSQQIARGSHVQVCHKQSNDVTADHATCNDNCCSGDSARRSDKTRRQSHVMGMHMSVRSVGRHTAHASF